MLSLRGLLCVLTLPLHTVLLGVSAIGASLVAPRREGVLALARLWSRIILAVAGVRVHPRGAERTAGGPYVVLCNHQSLFDIPALLLTFRRPFRIVAKRELFYIPVFGWALRTSGFIGIDRGRTDRAIASLSRGAAAIGAGRSLVLFAEGTRSRDGRLGRLKKGAFHLAQQVGVPMLPVTISGSRAVMPRQAWVPRPGDIDVQVGEPLPPAPPGTAIGDPRVREAEAALEAGYTARHQADLDRAMRPRGAAAPEGGVERR